MDNSPVWLETRIGQAWDGQLPSLARNKNRGGLGWTHPKFLHGAKNRAVRGWTTPQFG